MKNVDHPLPPELQTSLAEILARPDVWRGGCALTGAGAGAAQGLPACASGFAGLDAQLPGGGWPRGQLVELLSARPGVGELSLLLPALTQLAGAGKRVALVLPSGPGWQPYAPAWQAALGQIEPVLVLRPGSARDALWATVQCLRCPGVGATISWLEGWLEPSFDRGTRATPATRRPLQANGLRRLQIAAVEGAGCAFLLRPLACAQQSSPAPLRLVLQPLHGGMQIEVIKRRGAPARTPVWLELPRPLSLERFRHALVRTYAVPFDARFDVRSAAVV